MAVATHESAGRAVQLLDCTLRDGGYYNDWDFPTSLVEKYLRCLARAGIGVIEVGFRSHTADRYLGATAFSTDEFLDSVDVPEGLVLGAMVNAKDLTADGDPRAMIRHLFAPASGSRIALVRIATAYPELDGLTPAIELLQELGYAVGVNLMQVSSRTRSELEHFGALAQEWNLDVAYFADSLGGLRPGDVAGVLAGISSAFSGPVGCHVHDNMSFALANSLEAVRAGATWVDGTILGMGRGPGNARTEYLAVELSRGGLADIDLVPLLELVTGDFADLLRQYGWGNNIYYFLSAAYGIHPTYIQEMTRDGRYTTEQIVTALDQLRDAGGASFSQDRLDSAAGSLGFSTGSGSWDATGWCDGREVLIVGPGPAGQSHRAEVESFIKRTTPLVIALNVRPPIDPALVDAYVCCHPIRTLIDSDEIALLKEPVFMPRSVADHLPCDLGGCELRDYGMAVETASFEIEATQCTVPRLLPVAYALALASIGGAANVYLTGFDGFDPHDSRQAEMIEIFERYSQHHDAPPVVALTRTSYPIRQSSIYAV